MVELKIGTFKNAYLGQLFGYLQILDDKVRKPNENPSIGIILCKEANKAYAEYAVRDYSKPMGVATYKTLDDMPEKLRTALPDLNKMIEIVNNNNEEQNEQPRWYNQLSQPELYEEKDNAEIWGDGMWISITTLLIRW